LPPSLVAARAAVAADFDLDENWLNAGPTDLLKYRPGGLDGTGWLHVYLDVPHDRLEPTARALRAAVDEADAAVASRYAADACPPPFTRERQEHERRRFAGAQTVLDQVMSQ
jgi:hypothetical protein